MHLRHVARDRQSSVGSGLQGPTPELLAIATIGPNLMSQVVCLSAISGKKLLIAAGATIIGPRDPPPHDLSAAAEMATDPAIELPKDLIVANDGALVRHGPLVLLVPHTREIDDTAPSAPDRAVSMKAKQICQYHVGFHEMCQMCSCLCWKNLTGEFASTPRLFIE